MGSPTELDALRSCVRPEYAGMLGRDFERTIKSAISKLPEEAAEDFWQSLRSAGKVVGSTLQRSAPAIAQGAVSGGAMGGPLGAALGVAAGLASPILGGKAQTRAPAAPAVVTAPGPGAPSPLNVAQLPAGQGAAATLIALLKNPTIQQALFSQALGSAGARRIVTQSGVSIPPGAINNLLMQLLSSASEALEAMDGDEHAYLQNEQGEYLADPASPEQQAAVVLSHVHRKRPPTIEMDESIDSRNAAEVETVEFY